MRKCIWGVIVPGEKAVSLKTFFSRIREIRFWNLGCLELDFTASTVLKNGVAVEMGLDSLQAHFL
jgi:hypothetical protein